MNKNVSFKAVVGTQIAVAAALAGAWMFSPVETRDQIQAALGKSSAPYQVDITVEAPVRITPLYNDPTVVSDEDLAIVLDQIQPIFDKAKRKPNYIEHALRAWAIDAEFQNPDAMSGMEMVEFLTDHGKYLASWGDTIEPLLLEEAAGVKIRWGADKCASYHHDHLLACMTEAGIPLNHPVFTPARSDMTINDVIQQALYDFRVDEKETEWSAMAFGLWLAPSGVKSWHLRDGREVDFDTLAHRLMRGNRLYGVCSGTHRVYSLMVLIRLDDEYQILSKPVRQTVYAYLEGVRDSIIDSQFEDGRWPPNWPDGKAAVENPSEDPMYRSVIATGHHLEWLSIAPKDLHPPHEQIQKAAEWIVANVKSKTRAEIQDHYTFYSHVGAALAAWRQTRPAVFWKEWESEHPWQPDAEPAETDEAVESEAPATTGAAGAH